MAVCGCCQPGWAGWGWAGWSGQGGQGLGGQVSGGDGFEQVVDGAGESPFGGSSQVAQGGNTGTPAFKTTLPAALNAALGPAYNGKTGQTG